MVDPAPKETLTSCPFCKEPIQIGAIKCKHCSSTLVPIAENIGNPAGYSGSPNQSVQIVTNTQKTDESKESNKFITPQYYNTYLGHGWGILILSVVLITFMASLWEEKEQDAAIGLAVVGSVIIYTWFIGIMVKPSANKILPVIGAIIFTLALLGLFAQ